MFKEPTPPRQRPTNGVHTGDSSSGEQPMVVDCAEIKAGSNISSAYAALLNDQAAYRNRLDREKAQLIESEKATLGQVLLDSTDPLERALSSVADVSNHKHHAVRDLTEGVRLSLAVLYKRIADIGAERVRTIGMPFDPAYAEAVDVVTITDPAQDGIVIEELRPGYRVGTRVLRPAQVRVGQLSRQ
jgi:molecular chaperone GrpE